MHAAKMGKLEVVKHMSECNGFDPNVVDKVRYKIVLEKYFMYHVERADSIILCCKFRKFGNPKVPCRRERNGPESCR